MRMSRTRALAASLTLLGCASLPNLAVGLQAEPTGGVSVGVTDAVSGELIPAASVSMIDAEGLLWAELSVGADGRRVADVVAPGPATVGVYATGYTAPSGESFEIVVVGGETTMLDVALELSQPPASTVPPSSSTEPPPETVAANALPVTGGRLNAALLSVGFVMLVLGVQAVLAARRP